MGRVGTLGGSSRCAPRRVGTGWARGAGWGSGFADAGLDGQAVEGTDGIPPIRRGGALRAWGRQVRGWRVALCKGQGVIGSALEGGDGDFGDPAEVWGWGSGSEVGVGALGGGGEGLHR